MTVSNELSEVNQSLCKALVVERTANRGLEDALEVQSWEKTHADQQCQALLDININLSVTVQMLGDLVKHYIKDNALTQTSWEKEVELTNVLDDSTRRVNLPSWEQREALTLDRPVKLWTRSKANP